MTFEEHLQNHRNADGTYDLDAAEEDRRYELESEPDEMVKLAAKVARQERDAYVNRETAKLRKQFEQPALSASLELDVMVPLGDGTTCEFGDMNHIRIRTRKDLRVQVHLREARAFDAEMTHWLHTETLLNDGETVAEAIARQV